MPTLKTVTITVDGDSIRITPAMRIALLAIRDHLHPHYTGSATIAMETMTAHGLARHKLITFRERWAGMETTPTTRGVTAITALTARLENVR